MPARGGRQARQGRANRAPRRPPTSPARPVLSPTSSHAGAGKGMPLADCCSSELNGGLRRTTNRCDSPTGMEDAGHSRRSWFRRTRGSAWGSSSRAISMSRVRPRVRIRPMTPDDAQVALRDARGDVPGHVGPRRRPSRDWQHWLLGDDHDWSLFFVAEAGGEPAGVALYRHRPPSPKSARSGSSTCGARRRRAWAVRSCSTLSPSFGGAGGAPPLGVDAEPDRRAAPLRQRRHARRSRIGHLRARALVGSVSGVLSRLRAKCPECRAYTAVALGPGSECHACGRTFAAGLVRVHARLGPRG